MTETTGTTPSGWYTAEITDRQHGKQTVSGTAKPVAAWLRAAADEIDPPRPIHPPKPAMRPGMSRAAA